MLIIGLGLDLPQHQRCTWFYHMKVNAHKHKFFSPFTCVFLLHCVKTRALLCIHRHFFSPFMCVFLLHRMETARSMHTRTFFQSTPCVFLLHHLAKWKLSTIVHIATFCSSQHRLLWDINMLSDFCSYLADYMHLEVIECIVFCMF